MFFKKKKKKQEQEFQLELYEEEEIDALEEHIVRHFGQFESVLHEIVSPDIHVDIAMIAPTEEHNYYILVTMGMGAHRMNVPKELAEYKLERAEMMICLPPDWKINDNDEKWYWPLRWLKIMARLPLEQDTWLGWGHTVPNGEPFAENTELSCMLVLAPVQFGKEAAVCRMPDDSEINFYQMIPLYQDEMEFKLGHDAETLLDKMTDDMLTVVDINRPGACLDEDEQDQDQDQEGNELVQADFKAAFAANLKFIHQDEYTPDEIGQLFARKENQVCFSIGEVNFPTGKVVVADPLCYLYNPAYAGSLNHTIPPGSYPVYLSAYASERLGMRIIAARLKIADTDAVRYEIAMPEGKSIKQLNEPGVLAGFGVDAGLGCFCDKQTAQEYDTFIHDWHEQNPDKNHYDDYFAAFFAESYRSQPEVQREGGDFITWAIPETGNKIAMFASGLGDGFYQSLWGFDQDDQICELVIPFINPQLFEEN